MATATVGGLVGLERTTVPLIGSEVFHLTSDLAVFSFIIAFGVTKALTNLAAGALTARFRRKPLIVTGMLVQAAGLALAMVLLDRPLLAGIVSVVLLGLGTAMVHPALIAAVSDHAHPSRRANALGTYRFWRDIGYAAGALIA
ncbi:MFS transporter [Kitasatospora sp. NPDC001095]